MQLQYHILCVSQFTLNGRTNKGNRPDYSKAMPPDKVSWKKFTWDLCPRVYFATTEGSRKACVGVEAASAPARWLQARPFYEQFLERLRRDYAAGQVSDGVFGAMMSVALVNDGPVTIIVDTRE